ncbi:hypothetical protein [Clostridium sp. Marseille-QA1073]
MEVFREKIKELYTLLLNPIDAMFKLLHLRLLKKNLKYKIIKL